MVNKAKRYDPAFKQMVCKRLTSVGEDRLTVSEAAQEFGVKPSTLYNWLHTMYRIPESAKNVSEPPLPSGITSIRQALGIGLHCEELGLDSPEAELYCHQKGCTLEEVKAFLKWADLFFEDEQKLKQFPAGSARDVNEALQSSLKEYKDELAKKDKVIVEMTTELAIREKIAGDSELIKRLKGQGAKVSKQDRQKVVEIVDSLRADPRLKATTAAICKELGIACKTYYRWRNDPDGEDKRATCERTPNPRSLSPEEQRVIVEKFNAPEVADKSITEAFYYYLDRGEYYASESTIRRVLRAFGAEQSPRRDGICTYLQPSYRPSESEAKRPNEVWTLDVIPFQGRLAEEQYFVYVAVDVYSRLIVGYRVFAADNADNAIAFLSETLDKHGIQPNQLVLHSNNGPAMRAVDTLAMLKARGVTVLQSRPRESNDNQPSDNFFASLNIHMGLDSQCYESVEECTKAVSKAVAQYNNEHHRGINFVTPAERHAGRDHEVMAKRKATLEQAKAQNPNRLIKGHVMNCEPAGQQTSNPAPREAKEKSVATDDNGAN